jgi:hypothetical protein
VFAVTGLREPLVSRLMLLSAIPLLFMPFELTWLLQAHERMAPTAIGQVVVRILRLTAVVLFVHEPAHVTRYVVLDYRFSSG